MEANRLSLLYSLYKIINDSKLGNTSYTIAHFFLENYEQLPTLNIYDVAEQCFVSRASVRRFCKQIGFKNFVDLKKEFQSYENEKKYYISHVAKNDYSTILTNEINEMMKELDQRMKTDEVYQVAYRIFNSRRTIFVVSDLSSPAIKKFQQSMIFNQKIIYIVSELYDESALLQEATQEDYIFTFSINGEFASATRRILENCPAYKTLATISRNKVFYEWYNKIYYLSAHDLSLKPGTVYETYGTSYMLDIIFSEYTKNFK